MRRPLFCLAILCLLGIVVAGDDENIPAVKFLLNKQTLLPSETLNLTILVQQTTEDDTPVATFPEIPGFSDADSRSSVINSTWGGQPSRQIRFTCSYVPHGSGVFTIPPLKVRVKGREITSKTFTINVLNPDGTPNSRPFRGRPTPSPESPAAQPDPADFRKSASPAKLITRVSNLQPFQGEQVVVTYAIQSSLPQESKVELVREPDYRGFWKKRDERLDPEKERVCLDVDGVKTWQIPIDRFVLYPLQPGQVRLEPVEWKVTIKSGPEAGQVKSLVSEPKTLAIRPLPPGGAGNTDTGAYSTIQLYRENRPVTVGQAFPLYLALRGIGNPYTLPAKPPIPSCPGFEIVAVREKAVTFEPYITETAGQETIWGGEKIWEVTVYAKSPGALVFPSISFTFFDPYRAETRTLRTRPLTVQATSPPPPPISTVRPIPTVVKYLFIGLFLALLAALSMAAMVRFRRGRPEKERKKALGVGELLEEAAALVKTPASKAYFDILNNAVVRLVQEATGLSIQDMRRDEISDALERYSFTPEEIRDIIRVLDDCDEARFAGIVISVSRRREMLEEARRLNEALNRRNPVVPGN